MGLWAYTFLAKLITSMLAALQPLWQCQKMYQVTGGASKLAPKVSYSIVITIFEEMCF